MQIWIKSWEVFKSEEKKSGSSAFTRNMDQTSASTSEPKPVEVVDNTPQDSKERKETEEVAVAGTKRPSEAATEENKASNKKFDQEYMYKKEKLGPCDI